MKLVLYRDRQGYPLGTTLGFKHNGIRIRTRGEADADIFEHIAEHYGWSIHYSSNINECDLVVFNLDRNHIYANLNPVLFVKQEHWQVIRELGIPVVFWHSGECHSSDTEWYRFACNYTGINIWYVDSNYRTTGKHHLFFDSSDTVASLQYKTNDIDFSKIESAHDYKFSTITSRSEFHKNVIVAHLREKYPNSVYTKYTRSNLVEIQNQIYEMFPDFTITDITPDNDYLPRQHIISEMKKSCIVIAMNTYFTNIDPTYDPLYITDKFSSELSIDNPVIPVGHWGTVEYLKAQGYSFPDWIDYSYDSCRNDNDRLKMIIAEIDRLAKIENLAELSEQFSKTKCNFYNFQKNNMKKQFTECVNTILSNIINK